jgi:hypothetical protein
MTTLPATFDEALMTAYAREWIDRARARTPNPFDDATARAELREYLKVIADHNERSAARVLEAALTGIDGAHDALADLIEERNVRGEALGPTLSTYVHILLNRGPPPVHPPHGRPNQNFRADATIRYLVRDLLQQFPALRLRRRDRTSQRPSACSIAADALSKAGVRPIDEEAVRKIIEARLDPQKSGVVRFISHQFT